MIIRPSLLALLLVAGGIAAEEGAAPPAPETATPPAGQPAPTGEVRPRRSVAEMLAAVDTDQDGAISAAELAAVQQERLKSRLAEADANKDGSIDAAELAAFAKAREERRAAGGRPTPGAQPAPAPAQP